MTEGQARPDGRGCRYPFPARDEFNGELFVEACAAEGPGFGGPSGVQSEMLIPVALSTVIIGLIVLTTRKPFPRLAP